MKLDQTKITYQTDLKQGLRATQITENQKKYGKNKLIEKRKTPFIFRFLMQFTDTLILILLAAAIISVLIDPHQWVDALIILFVVVLNAALGLFQESRAEKSLEALKKMSQPLACVIRDGELTKIKVDEITLGDIMVFEQGDIIPADAVLFEVSELEVDESALTGESLPVIKTEKEPNHKIQSVGDLTNMVFSSTIVTKGRGKAVVSAIGMNTEVGKIAQLLNEEKEALTQLQKKLLNIGRVIGLVAITICLIVFALELFIGEDALIAFKTAIALAVAAIPEGLPAIVTLVLAVGVQKLVRANAIVKKLPAVETLGCTTVICSDKTGTLTENKMTVTTIYSPTRGLSDVLKVLDKKDVIELLSYFALCSNASVRHDNDTEILVGDPTEIALINALYKAGIEKRDLDERFSRFKEYPFDSERKMMSVIVEAGNKYLQITKGAFDVIIERTKNIQDKNKLNEINHTMASKALRVLAVAIKYLDRVPDKIIENDLEFIGLAGMIDPPRPEAKEAIATSKRAGIKTVMITGDHIITAKVIAKELGIYKENDIALTGAELSEMSDYELKRRVESCTVYARVSPVHKTRIVKAFQSNGHVVAMTGDGVNDSPALKAADIGCAMGITGTDVAKSAAGIILLDDDFATIVKAVRGGRSVYANIRKNVSYLLSSNIGEVVTILVASLLTAFTAMKLGIPLLPVHLLWINLITDSLPAFALGLEPAEADIMEVPPRQKNESFFARGLGFSIFWQGVMIGGITLYAYIIGNRINHEVGMTFAFVTLAFTQLFHAFNIKSEKSLLNRSTLNNKYLFMAFFGGIGLQLALLYVPFLSSIFRLERLTFDQILTCIILSFSVIIICELVKMVKYDFFKRKHKK
ncbi:MAG: calcium-translocating P-type ATPase, PMCA-type [Erysipelotrichales bacterium]|nr:calcium-translocating P-type ATPase, PMCA-type [Erysipelotrichales bacterium]